MDTILVVNAGSSSVKFQVFAADGKIGPRRLIKGQMDGIGTRPRLRAEAADKTPLIDQTYVLEQVGDVPAQGGGRICGLASSKGLTNPRGVVQVLAVDHCSIVRAFRASVLSLIPRLRATSSTSTLPCGSNQRRDRVLNFRAQLAHIISSIG
jgi:hypothetical protein